MSLITLFPTLRSQPISRVLRDSRPLWTTLDRFDEILADLGDSFHESRFTANEADTAYTFTVALPGFKKGDVEIEVSEEAYLTVRAGTRGERRCVERTITLPTDADTTKVEAKLEDGLLSLVIQKLEAAKPRKVTVN